MTSCIIQKWRHCKEKSKKNYHAMLSNIHVYNGSTAHQSTSWISRQSHSSGRQCYQAVQQVLLLMWLLEKMLCLLKLLCLLKASNDSTGSTILVSNHISTHNEPAHSRSHWPNRASTRDKKTCVWLGHSCWTYHQKIWCLLTHGWGLNNLCNHWLSFVINWHIMVYKMVNICFKQLNKPWIKSIQKESINL